MGYRATALQGLSIRIAPVSWCVVLTLLVSPVRASAGQSASISLGAVLEKCGCVVAGMPNELLSTPVLAAEPFQDAAGFVVAYWTTPRPETGPWHVIAGNARTGEWRHAQFDASDGDDLALRPGPIWSISRSDGFVFVGLRVAIDGIATSILTPDLRRIGATYGTITAVLPNGLFLHEEPHPHFAPTHWLVMRVLDSKTGADALAYPVRPFDRVRQQEIERERRKYAALGQDWCAAQNHHCDPELFDSDLSAEHAVVDARSGAVSFAVQYVPDGESHITVVVTCDRTTKIATIRCHETPLAAWVRLMPGLSTQQILERAAAQPTLVRP
jgi:hypothetical protein